MDPNRPISEVFCCVDPAKYIDSFDIGMWYVAHINKLFRTKQDHFIASTLLFLFYRNGRSLSDSKQFSVLCRFSLACFSFFFLASFFHV